MSTAKPSLAARVANWITGKGTDGPRMRVQGSVGEDRAGSGQSPISGASPAKNAFSGVDGIPPALARILRPAAASRWLMPSLGAITPQYVESVLRGAMAGSHVQQWELFDLMLDTWPELAACQAELVEGVMRKKLVFEPWCEEGEAPTDNALERQALVSAALRRMRPDPAADENDLDGTLRDILSGWMVGVTSLETDWHRAPAGKLGDIIAPRATFWVHPQYFGWNDAGRLTLRLQGSEMDFPAHKFLVGIHKAKSGPAMGNALLRPLAWWWCAANFASDWLLNLAQIFGLPFRWANYDPNAPQATVDAICSMLQNMGSAGWAAFPAGTTLELKHENISGDNSPQGELLDRADRYARLLLLGQTMSGSQDSSKGGGKAFGAVESKVKDERMEAAGKYACAVINGQLVSSILVLNFGDDDERPCVRLSDETEAGADDAQRDSILAGFMPLSKAQLRQKYNLQEPADEEDSTKPAAAKPPEVPSGKVPSAKEGKPEGEPEVPDADELEDAAAEELAGKLGALASIDDDALFAKQLTTLLDELK
jgi:phage gp29-like protein